MHVILLERVEKLGTIGDVVNVKPGFARNFLLPRGKALRATEANKARFEQDRARIEADNAKRRDIARSESREIEGASVVMIRPATFGAPTSPASVSRSVSINAEARFLSRAR